MADNETVELPDETAEALKRGEAAGDNPPAAPVERHGALASLLNLARRLRSTFAPLEPPPTFVADLKSQLLASAERLRAAAQRRRERKQKAIVAAVGVGSLVYVMGLTVMGVRLLLSFLWMLVTFISGRRPSQTQRPKGAR